LFRIDSCGMLRAIFEFRNSPHSIPLPREERRRVRVRGGYEKAFGWNFNGK
jgi:hypothetical protein